MGEPGVWAAPECRHVFLTAQNRYDSLNKRPWQSRALPSGQHRDSDNKHNKDTASCLALAMIRFSIICLWRESVCKATQQNVGLQTRQWDGGTKSDQGPISYPFSDVYHSSPDSSGAVSQEWLSKPPLQITRKPAKFSPPATACSQLSFSALLDLPHVPKGTKTKQPSHNPLSDRVEVAPSGAGTNLKEVPIKYRGPLS